MTRPVKPTARAVAALMALVLATVTACAPGPQEGAAAIPEPTHQGNAAPVTTDTETVLEVPDGPTVAIPEGAASGEGQLNVASHDDAQTDDVPGVSQWEVEMQGAELTG